MNTFNLALRTVENNIEDGIIRAGGDYGGEWTRDASINAWNAGSLVFPQETSRSLWAVTLDRGKTVGHQYWDKIIWVQGAFNHCMVTGEDIEPVYRCSAATMKELEDSVFCADRGLFCGPSVFNDGIAGYEEPIPDPELAKSGSIKHPNTGFPDGGWQNGVHWGSCRDQTWSATGYLRMFLTDVFGLSFGRKGMSVSPDVTVADNLGCSALSGIKYRQHDVTVRIEPAGDKKKGTYVNGRKVRQASVPCDGSESYEIVIYR